MVSQNCKKLTKTAFLPQKNSVDAGGGGGWWGEPSWGGYLPIPKSANVGGHAEVAREIFRWLFRYYDRKKRDLKNVPAVDNSYKWGGGGILSNVHDLLKFGNAMLNSFQPFSVFLSKKRNRT